MHYKQQTKKIILVAEDNPGIAELMKTILEISGFTVGLCSHGSKVEAEAKKLKPALIFMDLWLPGIDGATLTKKLKANRATKAIPIIIVSAQNKLDAVVKKVKADGFLAKPFELNEILYIVKKYLQ